MDYLADLVGMTHRHDNAINAVCRQMDLDCVAARIKRESFRGARGGPKKGHMKAMQQRIGK